MSLIEDHTRIRDMRRELIPTRLPSNASRAA
jgi:hypothetical protein